MKILYIFNGKRAKEDKFVKNKQKIVEYSMLIIGAFLIGLGIAACNKFGWGADPMSVLFDGLAKTVSISLGMATVLVSAVLVIVVLMVDRKQIGIGSVVVTLLAPVGVEIGFILIPAFADRYMNLPGLVIAQLVLSLGIAMTICANKGKGAYEALVVALCDKFNTKFYIIRWIFDILFLVVGVLLGGSLTFGTALAVVIMGRLITFFQEKITKGMNIIK